MAKKEFTFFWKTGDREIHKGENPAEALTLAGYGDGALGALDFYVTGDNKEYVWGKEQNKWIKNPIE